MLSADLAILNANIITLNPKQPRAQALAVYDGKIVAVGSNRDIRRYVSQTTKIADAKNKTLVPGLVDCHVHMTGFGYSLQSLNLRNVRSIKEMQQKLQEYAKRNREGSWITGGRWDQENFAEKRYPTRWDLDKAEPDRPVFLQRVCGHLAVANTKALQLSGITKEAHVEGGQIDIDHKTSEPNGVLRENAVDLVWKVIPKPREEDIEKACLLACQNAAETGLTGVHWIVGSAKEIKVLQKLHSEGKLPIRVYLGIPVNYLDKLAALGLSTGFGSPMLKIGFIKILADGSLGARTAALKAPYSDKPQTSGMMLYSQKNLSKLVSKAHKLGMQLAVHAIGDRATEIVLNAFKEAQRQFPSRNCRHRIEHCSVLTPKLVRQMKQLDIIASVQPHFVVSDFWVEERLGKTRARWVYPFETLVKQGLTVVSGSDCPVEPISPILGVWAAVAKQRIPDENLTVEEALRTYTVNAAYASFVENEKGTIETGKCADFVILSADVLRIPREKIKEVIAEMTVVDGKIVYVSKGFQKTG